MELKIYGPSDAPDEDFEKDLRTLFAVDPNEWAVIENWFLTSKSFDPDEALSSPAFIASALVPEQFRASVSAIKYLLEVWHQYGLQLADIYHDLMVLGHPGDEAERVCLLLGRLEKVKVPVYKDFMRFKHENAVLPTLENIDVVCDVRPVFEEHVYPLPASSRTSHTKLLGFSYMVLMELIAEDIEGQNHKLAFQMTEERLADFRDALQRATDQLDTLKKRTGVLSNERR